MDNIVVNMDNIVVNMNNIVANMDNIYVVLTTVIPCAIEIGTTSTVFYMALTWIREEYVEPSHDMETLLFRFSRYAALFLVMYGLNILLDI